MDGDHDIGRSDERCGRDAADGGGHQHIVCAQQRPCIQKRACAALMSVRQALSSSAVERRPPMSGAQHFWCLARQEGLAGRRRRHQERSLMQLHAGGCTCHVDAKRPIPGHRNADVAPADDNIRNVHAPHHGAQRFWGAGQRGLVRHARVSACRWLRTAEQAHWCRQLAQEKRAWR